MFTTYQHGLISLFYSIGQNPLSIWSTSNKSGSIRRIVDVDLKSTILDLQGMNTSTTYIECPSCPKESLGIYMSIFVILFKNIGKYFVFEIEIVEHGGRAIRFRAGNFYKMTSIKSNITTIPLNLSEGWNTVVIDLKKLVQHCYGKTFLKVNRIRINANCRIRRVYFCDRIYSEDELPEEYKLTLLNDNKHETKEMI